MPPGTETVQKLQHGHIVGGTSSGLIPDLALYMHNSKKLLLRFVTHVAQLIPPNVIKAQPVIIPHPPSIQVRSQLLIGRCDSLDILCGDPWNDRAETTRESQLHINSALPKQSLKSATGRDRHEAESWA
jgi:hypothetical protein